MRPDRLASLLFLTSDERDADDEVALDEQLRLLEEIGRRTRLRTATYGKRSAQSFLAPPRASWDTIH